MALWAGVMSLARAWLGKPFSGGECEDERAWSILFPQGVVCAPVRALAAGAGDSGRCGPVEFAGGDRPGMDVAAGRNAKTPRTRGRREEGRVNCPYCSSNLEVPLSAVVGVNIVNCRGCGCPVNAGPTPNEMQQNSVIKMMRRTPILICEGCGRPCQRRHRSRGQLVCEKCQANHMREVYREIAATAALPRIHARREGVAA